MADINQQTEELARKFEQLAQAMGQYDQLTKSSADQKRDAEVQAATGMKNFTKGAAAGADAVGELAGAAISAGKSMLEGKKGAAAFNDSIDGMAKAAQAAGVALALLIPGGPAIKLLIAGITALTGAVAGLVKESNIMADKLYKSYSGLAKSGAAASDGMTGVFTDAKKLGLSMNELDSMVSLVGENSKDLALFAGSVFEGRKQFADMGAAMEPYRKQMIAAGLTQEQINEGTMGYLKLQTRLGQSQNKTTAELASGAKKYLEEQDALTKLTGMTRKEQEDAREEIRSQERFAAVLMEMRAKGQHKEAEELEASYLILKSQSKEAAQGFADVSTGMINTEAAQKSFMATQGESMRASELVRAGEITAAEAAQRVAAAHGRTADSMGASLGKMGVYNETFGDLAADLRLKGMSGKDIEEQLKKVKQEQIDQGLKGGKAADGITGQYAKNITQQQKLNEKMETVVFKGIDNALVITNKLGTATNSLATGFEVLGKAVNKLLNVLGLGVKEPAAAPVPKTAREAEAVAAVSKERSLAEPLGQLTETKRKQLEADEKALMDAKRSGKFGDDLKPLEEKIIKAKEDYATASKDLAEQQKKVTDATREERKVKMQQKQDQNRLMLLEGINIRETEGIARLNVEKADLAAKGVNTAKKDQRIAEFKASIEERNKQIATIKQRLAPVAPPAGTAPAAAAGAAPAAAGAPAPAAAGAPAPAPAPAGAAPAAPLGRKTKTAEDELAGLTIKEGDVHVKGAKVNPKIVEMAKQVQSNMPDFAYFSGFNDKFHQEKAPTSSHTKGNAMDFVLGKHPTKKEGDEIVKYLKSLGASVAIDEYNNPSSNATAGHIHAQINGYADGGIAKNPQIAMVAEKGPEAMIPLVDGAIPIKITSDFIDSGFDRDMRQEVVEPEVTASKSTVDLPAAPVARESSVMMDLLKEAKEQNLALLNMLSELVREQRNANDISTRILQVSSN
jgi:hypothetical protein